MACSTTKHGKRQQKMALEFFLTFVDAYGVQVHIRRLDNTLSISGVSHLRAPEMVVRVSTCLSMFCCLLSPCLLSLVSETTAMLQSVSLSTWFFLLFLLFLLFCCSCLALSYSLERLASREIFVFSPVGSPSSRANTPSVALFPLFNGNTLLCYAPFCLLSVDFSCSGSFDRDLFLCLCARVHRQKKTLKAVRHQITSTCADSSRQLSRFWSCICILAE